ncbi:unnamed protein product [Polarella glacialis]|uniref:Helicase C-terminal domain-containing protein n=1 Tax=Polarella glacialis TaxID=89957 RepID=A0A813HKU0_POLGL|nr:unnamed protein product [Polarella glacialis]
MADLLAELGEGQRACIIVPKLDLMEQIAQLLESLALPGGVTRVGTGHVPDMEARVFVCVRNSAWRLADLNFDVLILDEAHHYEPGLATAKDDTELLDDGPDHATDATLGPHASTVLGLHAKKRVFFSATLRGHQPDFDVGLREAVRAGVITDYTILVPFITDGDPKPSLVELVRNLPTARRILAFCNTVHEAKHFAQLLNSAGVPAGHYNGGTARSKRAGILELFEQGPARGGIRVLVTVDVLSEGVDLPMADTCMFVEPRRGLRLRQCVGRVLRQHMQKVDALVISPPIVQKAGGDLEADTELIRLLSELASADEELQNSLVQDSFGRIGIIDQRGNLQDEMSDLAREDAAKLLSTSVYPRALSGNHSETIFWELGFTALERYAHEHGNCRVPPSYRRTAASFSLGQWVQKQRRDRLSGILSAVQIDKLDNLEFIWRSDRTCASWQVLCRQLASYKQKYGHTNVPQSHVTDEGVKLGQWVKNKRSSKRGKPGSARLSAEQAETLEKLGFMWEPIQLNWEQSLSRLEAYKEEYGDTVVPVDHVMTDGFLLGAWAMRQRTFKRGKVGNLDGKQIEMLDRLGFVWEHTTFLWERGFQHVKSYKTEHGDMMVPSAHITADGFNLGTWVTTQRSAKRGRGNRGLDSTQIEMLDQLGFVWDPLSFLWEHGCQYLKAYKAKHGDMSVPKMHITSDGFHLGNWVAAQRSAKRDVGNRSLDSVQIEMLDLLGFVWKPLAFLWERGFSHLKAYKSEHGDVLVPSTHITADGCNLGRWVARQRSPKLGKGSAASLTAIQIEMLDVLGFVWESASFWWEQGFKHLKAYKAEHGETLVPKGHITADGFRLGHWVAKQRSAKRCTGNGSLDQFHIDTLDKLGFVWEPLPFLWEQGAQHLKAYKAEHGDVLVPSTHLTSDGFHLGQWVARQRSPKPGKGSAASLTAIQIEMLDVLGFVWESASFWWEQGFKHLKAYKEEHGETLVPKGHVIADGFRLGHWVAKQRSAKRCTGNGSLDQFHIDTLDKLGFVWEPVAFLWEQGAQHLKAYKAEHGDMSVPRMHITSDGFHLGIWVSTQRSAKRGVGNRGLDSLQIEMLDHLGFVWESYSCWWEQGFQHLKAFKAEHGDTLVRKDHITAGGFHLGYWVSNQRSAKRRKSSAASLNGIQMEMLDVLGFVWEPVSFRWEQGFSHLKAYKSDHGDTIVPYSHVTADGFHLGHWVSSQREAKRSTSKSSLSQYEIDMLEKLGFVWEHRSWRWEQGVHHLEAYKAQHGDTLVPQSHVAADGFRLGIWVSNRRSAKRGTGNSRLDQFRINILDKLGFVWDLFGKRHPAVSRSISFTHRGRRKPLVNQIKIIA